VAGSGTEDEKAELYYWRWLLKLSSQVTFHGYLSSEKLDGLLAQAHVYVQPSINEGLPNTLLRVVMNKIPVVASRVDGIPEVVTHEVNGLLVPPGDVEALAQALQRCVFDVSLRNQIGQAEQPHVSTDPTVEVGEYRSMYSKIAHR
jgi:glycosyltransferase involved in cell wall biosynthesis